MKANGNDFTPHIENREYWSKKLEQMPRDEITKKLAPLQSNLAWMGLKDDTKKQHYKKLIDSLIAKKFAKTKASTRTEPMSEEEFLKAATLSATVTASQDESDQEEDPMQVPNK